MVSRTEFLETYGAIYEHSPWIAEAAFDAGAQTPEQIHMTMKAAVAAAPREKQLALIKAHPELGSRVKMAEASVAEQSGAGLDRCTPEEFEAFQTLNAAYNKKFGFPFIVAVKGLTRQDILREFRTRMDNAPDAEFKTALEQIHKIAHFRLAALEAPERKAWTRHIADDTRLQSLFMYSLAFGAGSWFVVFPFFFLIDRQRDLLSVMGLLGYLGGSVLAAPVFALFIYIASRVLYALRKRQNQLPANTSRLVQTATIYALPAILLISWLLYSLFYQSFESYTQAASGAMNP